MVASGQLHGPAALSTEKELRYPLDPRDVLDAVVKKNIPSPRRESNPRTPIVQPVVQRYTDWAITALTQKSGITFNILLKNELR
jgi:hypothetical protein